MAGEHQRPKPSDSQQIDFFAAVLSELTNSLSQLSMAQGDNIRSAANLQESLNVVLRKIDKMEEDLSRIMTKTEGLDATHYSDLKEAKRVVESLRGLVDDLRGQIKQVSENTITRDRIQTLLSDALKEYQKTCPARPAELERVVGEAVKEAFPGDAISNLRVFGNKWLLLGVIALILFLSASVVFLSGVASYINIGKDGIEISRDKDE